MPHPDQRDVWVSAAVRHVPAHRVPLHSVPVDEAARAARAMWVLSCPPFLASGGVVITRAAATVLEAFPCLRCFPPAVQA